MNTCTSSFVTQNHKATDAVRKLRLLCGLHLHKVRQYVLVYLSYQQVSLLPQKYLKFDNSISKGCDLCRLTCLLVLAILDNGKKGNSGTLESSIQMSVTLFLSSTN